MNIYIASPLFYEWQKAEVRRVADWLKNKHFKGFSDLNIYCPQDFQVENSWKKKNVDWAQEVFTEDLRHLQEADLVVCLSYGHQSDDGAAWEVGYSQACNKSVWLIAQDEHVPYSLMFLSVDKLFRGADFKEIEFSDIEWK